MRGPCILAEHGLVGFKSGLRVSLWFVLVLHIVNLTQQGLRRLAQLGRLQNLKEGYSWS